jgi:uncharacterized protein with NAD-binding domain and iron-sulfur cluster
MAGLTAAWQLSRPGWREELASITVYQRGWTLGGKGASVRGTHGRIEEHGLHVWLGYYHNAFRLMREVYAELERPTTDPTCRVQTFDDAFFAAGDIGVGVEHAGDWSPWIARVGRNDLEPGAGDLTGQALTPTELLSRAIQLVVAAAGSVTSPTRRLARRGVFLSASSTPPRSPPSGLEAQVERLRSFLRQAELVGLVASIGGLGVLQRAAQGTAAASSIVLEQLDAVRKPLADRLQSTEAGRRSWQIVDLVMGCAQGMIEDQLLTEESFATIDHLDFREWLAGRVAPTTLDSPLITGMYDLVFAYQGGDRERPRFAAGLGLLLAARLFFEYRGSVFWKMRAGMGDIVFAPLYQALRGRGVRFEFFHRLDRLRLAADGRSVACIEIEREAALARGDYEPLVRVGDLPCFPAEPLIEQLGSNPPGAMLSLEAGRDFDVAVLAVSLGAVPDVAAELIGRSNVWRQLVENVSTVGTRAFQAWLRPDEQALGWDHPGATVSGYRLPFDTYASMSHVIAAEGWSPEDPPGAAAYFCSVLPDELTNDPAEARAAVDRDTRAFLSHHAGAFWPRATDADSRFRWDLLHRTPPTADEPASTGLYVRANTDASDRYVQSLPGSSRYRLRVDQSGVDNLVLAGDWTNCGLNAGCIEAAVMSGMQAANVVMSRPLEDRLVGRWYGLDDEQAPAGATVAAAGVEAGR